MRDAAGPQEPHRDVVAEVLVDTACPQESHRDVRDQESQGDAATEILVYAAGSQEAPRDVRVAAGPLYPDSLHMVQAPMALAAEVRGER